ncbi:MAG TPA: redoxin domain-containing protein [Anaerolineaceae bacterium]
MDIDSQNFAPAIGRPAPDFVLCDLNDDEFSLSSDRGKIVILNFWSAECGWSERVDQELVPALARWGSAAALYSIAANDNESPELLLRVSRERGLPRLLLDHGQKVTDLYEAISTPEFFVIDQQGILRYRGAFDDVSFRQHTPTRAYLIPAVEALLAGRLPDPADTPAFGCTIVRYAE